MPIAEQTPRSTTPAESTQRRSRTPTLIKGRMSKRSLAVAVIATAALVPAGSAMAQDQAASVRSKAKTAHCAPGKIRVHRGKVEACLKAPRGAAKTKTTRGRSVSQGRLVRQQRQLALRRRPVIRPALAVRGFAEYRFVCQQRGVLLRQSVHRDAPLRPHHPLPLLLQEGFRWYWWGDNQCMGLNNGVYGPDSCYSFGAR